MIGRAGARLWVGGQIWGASLVLGPLRGRDILWNMKGIELCRGGWAGLPSWGGDPCPNKDSESQNEAT